MMLWLAVVDNSCCVRANVTGQVCVSAQPAAFVVLLLAEHYLPAITLSTCRPLIECGIHTKLIAWHAVMQIQDGQQQGFFIEQLQQQATEVTQAAAAMPLAVRRIDNTLEQLETGNLKLR
jgi:small neutral amino acid transporter SnatA (MarC family)